MNRHRTQSGYTPGQWSLNVCDDWDGANVTDKHGRIVALCDGCDIPGSSWEVGTDEAKANARLIASAPELLEALEECITYYGAACFKNGAPTGDDAWRRIIAINEIATAAIRKARGE